MVLDYQKMIALISQTIWPMARVGGFVISAPVFSSAMLPSRIKILCIFVLSWLCAPWVPDHLSFLYFDGLQGLYLFQELGLGVLMGFSLQLVFQIVLIGGQIIAMQAGMGYAVMMDPASKASVPLLGQFYLLVMTLLFLGLNGHLVIIETLIESFKTLPIGKAFVSTNHLGQFFILSGWMFKKALLVSIPALLSLLMVSLSFGIMARAAPQLNIFSLGFPLTLLMGMLIVKVGLNSISEQMRLLIDEGLRFVQSMVH